MVMTMVVAKDPPEDVLLMLSQLYSTETDENERGRCEGAQRKSRCHLSENGSSSDNSRLYAVSGSRLANDRKYTKIVGIRSEDKAEGHACDSHENR